MTTRSLTLLAAVLASIGVSACAPAPADAGPVRLGYFANLTHAPALIGLERGYFEDELGSSELETQKFSAGPAAIEALSAGAVDATYIGAAPIANSYVRSEGRSAVVIAGATNGGAGLVVREEIAADIDAGKLSPGDLRYATPGLGNTQDVALRSWLQDQGFEPSLTGQGDAGQGGVGIAPMSNSQIFTLFSTDKIDAAWLAEPWKSRLLVEDSATEMLDEAEIWPGGDYPSAVLAVNQDFLDENPEEVDALLRAHLKAIDHIHAEPEQAVAEANHRLEQDAGAELDEAILERAWPNLDFDADIPTVGLQTYHDMAVRTRLQPEGSLAGLTVPTPLDELREERR